MRARIGRILACAAGNKFQRWLSTPAIRTDCLQRYSGILTVRMTSAASSARPTAGSTWAKVLYKDENTGGSDIEMDPSNPDVLYASLWEVREGPWEDNNQFQGTGGGLFKSTDGGNTWNALTNGLPNNMTQVNVAIAPSQPNRLFAAVATTEKGDYGSGAGLGLYRSDDAGESWHSATTDPRPAMRIGGGDLANHKSGSKKS